MSQHPSAMTEPSQPPIKTEIGWREWVGLPVLGIQVIKAKVDTGARTSALHAEELDVHWKDNQRWVDFCVPSPLTGGFTRCRAMLVDERPIKNTSGLPEARYVIETRLVLAGRAWRIELSLANRTQMGFDLILGRTAIRRRRLLVNPGKSFLLGLPKSAPPGLTLPLEDDTPERFGNFKNNDIREG